jgi:hypothetical protein
MLEYVAINYKVHACILHAPTPPPEEWRVRYNVSSVYHCAKDEGWARLSVALAKSAEEANIITVDNDDEDDSRDGSDDGEGSGVRLD